MVAPLSRPMVEEFFCSQKGSVTTIVWLRAGIPRVAKLYRALARLESYRYDCMVSTPNCFNEMAHLAL